MIYIIATELVYDVPNLEEVSVFNLNMKLVKYADNLTFSKTVVILTLKSTSKLP